MIDQLPACDIPAADDAMVVRIREGLRDHVAGQAQFSTADMTWPALPKIEWQGVRLYRAP